MIGAAYYEEGKWYIKQWFANGYEEEAEILSAFFTFARSYTHLIHFSSFDIEEKNFIERRNFLQGIVNIGEMYRLP